MQMNQIIYISEISPSTDYFLPSVSHVHFVFSLLKGSDKCLEVDLFFLLFCTQIGNFKILVGSSMGGWLMLLAALARPEKIAALVGISTAADHFVTAFHALPIEVRKSSMSSLKHFKY